jgi:oligopeptide/dipeptide ABC transporter ATP-binding protein
MSMMDHQPRHGHEDGPAAPLLAAHGLSVVFGGRGLLRRSAPVRAVSDVDFHVRRGEAVGLVGESGSGKSTLGRALIGLIEPGAGDVLLEGQPLRGGSRSQWRALRRRLQVIFQDPYGSLDPRRRIGAQIADGLDIHGLLPPSQQPARVGELLDMVGLDAGHAERYPHEFSGGQRQRIGIARALATGPDLIVADEPVSSLDVSIQAQILDLMDRLRRDLNLALVFISHDLPVVRHLCDRVVVLYLGRVMEEGPAAAVFAAPRHPYTRALLSATPRLHAADRHKRIVLPGEPPSPSAPPSGCVFRTRCSHAVDACGASVPALTTLGGGHRAACLRLDEIDNEPTDREMFR